MKSNLGNKNKQTQMEMICLLKQITIWNQMYKNKSKKNKSKTESNWKGIGIEYKS